MSSTALAWERCAARSFLDDPQLRRDWDALNAACGAPPVLASEFIAAALNHLASGAEQLLVARRGEAAVAMAVMAPVSRLQWATFQPSQLPLGAFVSAPGEDLTTLGLQAMRSVLRSALAVSFTQVDPRLAARGGDGPSVRHDNYVETAWVSIEGDFDSYWATRGKNLRQNLRKQRNRLASEGASFETRTWRAKSEVVAALARYGDLESLGWKATQGTAIESGNVQGRFYRALLEAAAERGEALVHEYLLGGRTVAMNLSVLRGRTLVILKTTYDESTKPLSPAFLLHEDQLREFFASGAFDRVEYYGRVMEWHTRWTDHKRMLFHTTVYRWPIVRALAERRRRMQTPAPAPTPSHESVA